MLALLLLNRMSMKRRSTGIRHQIEKKKPEADYCRTCLASKDLVDIFHNKDSEKKRSQDLKIVTGLEIKLNDGLSQKICTKCVDILNTSLQFRRKCRKAEKALLGLALGTKIKKKYRTKGMKLKSVKKSKPPLEVTTDYNKRLKTKVIDYDYDNMETGDDWQNEGFDVPIKGEDDYQDFMVKTEDAEQRIKQFSKPGPKKKRKRSTIPNATSYKCNTCNKEFRMKATYKAHMRFHTNYCVCESCGKRCRNNNQLQEHKRARHGLGRIHKCAYCEYSSATKEALTIHERRHTGERPYICDHCGASFHRRSNLVQHIAIHLPEKNFQCDMCPKRLKSRKFLQIHKHNAHTGKRYGYLCAICSHRFEKPNKVRAHTRRVHGLPDDQQAPVVRVQL